MELPPNDAALNTESQSFEVAQSSAKALDSASRYLTVAGHVAPALRGDLQVQSDHLVVHHGRIRTRISTEDLDETHCKVTVERLGAVPLEGTRRWVFMAGIVGFVLAWALAWYNSGSGGLSAFVTISFFFLGMTALVSVLYLVDRSLERRGVSLCQSLGDAMQGNPEAIVRREIDALERTSSIANAVLFYCAALIVEFLIYVVLFQDGIRQGINEAVAVDTMAGGFGYPVIPAILFGLGWFWYVNRIHKDRLGDLPA